mmetsp:Transcript_47723/g.91202  ORF Transcript_47723/g.91202 Transcript_47723/m.91202 type:complete len:274 (-) Transcript_47723:307-1128(-)|eukprot:CAMPEP_0114245568 /NCGR_PEP_ID=MMETSP0058-20121206/11970_1 /TAXON_ID=36894 /ORGANISM="Pyramimonas parkeae, CCMP726" /LENGTH=273 /DNA_ID=CAMNT_0001358639 /DNA_START=324 /DNA_END=1145 /DNA_ORIENTATION=-
MGICFGKKEKKEVVKVEEVDEGMLMSPEEMEAKRKEEEVKRKSTLQEALDLVYKARLNSRDTIKRLTILKNVVAARKTGPKWKTVEFKYNEVAYLEKLLKGMEARLTEVVDNLSGSQVMLRAEAEVKAIKDGRKDLGIKELEILLERYKQFQFMALKPRSVHKDWCSDLFGCDPFQSLEERLGITSKTVLKAPKPEKTIEGGEGSMVAVEEEEADSSSDGKSDDDDYDLSSQDGDASSIDGGASSKASSEERADTMTQTTGHEDIHLDDLEIG